MWDISTPDFKTNKVEYRYHVIYKISIAVNLTIFGGVEFMAINFPVYNYYYEFFKLSVVPKSIPQRIHKTSNTNKHKLISLFAAFTFLRLRNKDE